MPEVTAATFIQCIDATRPHTLLTPLADCKRAAFLNYRYDDTGEVVKVPHIWYNSHYKSSVGYIRWLATLERERADKLKKQQPFYMTPERIEKQVAEHLARAARISAEADRMEAAGDPAYPVAASLLQLDFGPNVGC